MILEHIPDIILPKICLQNNHNQYSMLIEFKHKINNFINQSELANTMKYICLNMHNLKHLVLYFATITNNWHVYNDIIDNENNSFNIEHFLNNFNYNKYKHLFKKQIIIAKDKITHEKLNPCLNRIQNTWPIFNQTWYTNLNVTIGHGKEFIDSNLLFKKLLVTKFPL